MGEVITRMAMVGKAHNTSNVAYSFMVCFV